MKKLAILILPLLLLLLLANPSEAFVPDNQIKQFKIFNNGLFIGYHTLKFSKDGRDTIVDIQIDMKASVMFVPLFRYHHTNRERWRNGQLIALESDTNDNGKGYFVDAHRQNGSLLVNSKENDYGTPYNTMSSSYWLEATAKQKQLINTQDGQLVTLNVVETADDSVLVGKIEVPATRYRVKGDLDATFWYTKETGEWIGLNFEINDNTIRYVPVPEDQIRPDIHKEQYSSNE